MNAQTKIKRRDETIIDSRSDVVRWFESDDLTMPEIMDKVRQQGKFAPLYAALVVEYLYEKQTSLDRYYKVPHVMEMLSDDGWE